MSQQVMKVKDKLNSHRRWCKGDLVTTNGRVCLIGAVDKCYSGRPTPILQRILKTIKVLFPNRIGYPPNIVNFNDHTDTTFNDVRKVILKANV